MRAINFTSILPSLSNHIVTISSSDDLIGPRDFFLKKSRRFSFGGWLWPVFVHVCCSGDFGDVRVVFRSPVDVHLNCMIPGGMTFFSLCFSCGFSFSFSTIGKSNVV